MGVLPRHWESVPKRSSSRQSVTQTLAEKCYPNLGTGPPETILRATRYRYAMDIHDIPADFNRQLQQMGPLGSNVSCRFTILHSFGISASFELAEGSTTVRVLESWRGPQELIHCPPINRSSLPTWPREDKNENQRDEFLLILEEGSRQTRVRGSSPATETLVEALAAHLLVQDDNTGALTLYDSLCSYCSASPVTCRGDLLRLGHGNWSGADLGSVLKRPPNPLVVDVRSLLRPSPAQLRPLRHLEKRGQGLLWVGDTTVLPDSWTQNMTTPRFANVSDARLGINQLPETSSDSFIQPPAYTLSRVQLAGIRGLDLQRRLHHFVKRVADTELIWCLKLGQEWHLVGSSDQPPALAVWPHPTFASSFARERSLLARPESIGLARFLESMLPWLDNRATGLYILPFADEMSVPVSVDILAAGLLKELDSSY
jgi:hypothetical protein